MLPIRSGLPAQHTCTSVEKTQSDIGIFDDADEDAEVSAASNPGTSTLSQDNTIPGKRKEGGNSEGVAVEVPRASRSPVPEESSPTRLPTPGTTKPNKRIHDSPSSPSKPKASTSNVVSEDEKGSTTDHKMEETAGVERNEEDFSDLSDTEEDPTILTNIRKPGSHDVLYGRGGLTNRHPGNVRFRALLKEHKMRYINAWKADKPKVAREVVAIWRAMDPPGRFLAPSKSEPHPNPARGIKVLVWHDVGKKRAQEKTSQCLREKTSQIKAAEAMASLHNKAHAMKARQATGPSGPLGSEEMKRDRFGRAVPLAGNVAPPPPPPHLLSHLRPAVPPGAPTSLPPGFSYPPVPGPVGSILHINAPPTAAPPSVGLSQTSSLPPPPIGALQVVPPEVQRIIELQDRIKAARSRIESAQGRMDAQSAALGGTATALMASLGGGAPCSLPLPGPAAVGIQNEALSSLLRQQYPDALAQALHQGPDLRAQKARQDPNLLSQKAWAAYGAAAAASSPGVIPPPDQRLPPAKVGSSHTNGYSNLHGAGLPPGSEAFFTGLP